MGQAQAFRAGKAGRSWIPANVLEAFPVRFNPTTSQKWKMNANNIASPGVQRTPQRLIGTIIVTLSPGRLEFSHAQHELHQWCRPPCARDVPTWPPELIMIQGIIDHALPTPPESSIDYRIQLLVGNRDLMFVAMLKLMSTRNNPNVEAWNSSSAYRCFCSPSNFGPSLRKQSLKWNV